MKIIKFLEIAWLVISIAGVFFTSFAFIKGNSKDGIMFTVFTIISVIFYFIRRRQRIKMANSQNSNPK